MEQALHFPRRSYPSLQVGDVLYKHTQFQQADGFTLGTGSTLPNRVGPVINIEDSTIVQDDGTVVETTRVTVDTELATQDTLSTDFIFFVKNGQVNISSLVGYYGTATFENSTNEKCELFSVTAQYNESSK